MATSIKHGILRLDDQLCFALYAATNAVVRAYRPLLAEVGLTYPQYLVMLALWQDGVTPVHELAARLQLGPSAITPLVDRLEAAGLVTRARAADRRLVLVALTEAGRALEDRAATVQGAVVCRTGLAEGDLAALRQELKDLTDRIATSGAVPRNEPP
ncbi:MarR family winged helix-turn-helix transcriptional regulator [Methylobacterium segetis]|uniref:MarR family winged helix-turn-helix transcriptional regulator n=1 Tax=Methylobacterium segetis TaxID=2488750 RepID=UPI0010470C91|nr:MarR family transcriptional regulator [Methylobacterium segetis]